MAHWSYCEYPQFLWDRLPISGPEESILRLDHLQPIGTHHNSYELCGRKLSDDALEVVDELLQWLIRGGVQEDSLIAIYRAEIESTFGDWGYSTRINGDCFLLDSGSRLTTCRDKLRRNDEQRAQDEREGRVRGRI